MTSVLAFVLATVTMLAVWSSCQPSQPDQGPRMPPNAPMPEGDKKDTDKPAGPPASPPPLTKDAG